MHFYKGWNKVHQPAFVFLKESKKDKKAKKKAKGSRC